VQKLGITFPILLDQETRVVALYNPRATAPYSVLIGRDGRVLRRQEGYTPADHDELARAVDAALRRVAASETHAGIEPHSLESRHHSAHATDTTQRAPALPAEE
jgi:hypothetical protein